MHAPATAARCTFKLAVINYKLDDATGTDASSAPINPYESVIKESVHVFTKRAKDWCAP